MTMTLTCSGTNRCLTKTSTTNTIVITASNLQLAIFAIFAGNTFSKNPTHARESLANANLGKMKEMSSKRFTVSLNHSCR
jgi:hypothetical protein